MTYTVEKYQSIEVKLDLSDILDVVSDLSERDLAELKEHISGFNETEFEVKIPNLSAKLEFEEWHDGYKKRWNL